MEFSHLLPLNFHTIERLIAQTLTTPFQSVKWSFGAAGEALEEAKDGKYNMELVAGSGELDKTRFREALLE